MIERKKISEESVIKGKHVVRLNFHFLFVLYFIYMNKTCQLEPIIISSSFFYFKETLFDIFVLFSLSMGAEKVIGEVTFFAFFTLK